MVDGQWIPDKIEEETIAIAIHHGLKLPCRWQPYACTLPEGDPLRTEHRWAWPIGNADGYLRIDGKSQDFAQDHWFEHQGMEDFVCLDCGKGADA